MDRTATFDSIATVDLSKPVRGTTERRSAARLVDIGDDADERCAALIMALARTGRQDATALHDVYRMTHGRLAAVCLTVRLDYQDARAALQGCYLAL